MGEEKNKIVDYFIEALEMEEKEPDDRRMIFLYEKNREIELCNTIFADKAKYDAYEKTLIEEKNAVVLEQQKALLDSINLVNEAKSDYDKINEEYELCKQKENRIAELENQLHTLDEQIDEENRKNAKEEKLDEEKEFYIDFLKERKEECLLEIYRIREEENSISDLEEALEEKKKEYLGKIAEQKMLDEKQKEELRKKQEEINAKLAANAESYKRNRPEEKWVEIEMSINEGHDQYTVETFKRAQDRVTSLKKEIANESVNLLKEDIKEYYHRRVEPIMKVTDYIYSYARQGRTLTNEDIADYINSNMGDVKEYMYKDFPDMMTNPKDAINNPANQYKALKNYQQTLRMEGVCDYMSSNSIGINDDLSKDVKREMNTLVNKDYISDILEYKEDTREFIRPLDKGARMFFNFAEKASLVSQAKEGKELHTYDDAMAVATEKCRADAEWFKTIKAKTYSLVPVENPKDSEGEIDTKAWNKVRYDTLDSDLKRMAKCYESIKRYGGNLDIVGNDCKTMRDTIEHIRKNVEQNRSSRELYTHIGAMENLLFEIDIRKENYDKDREKENFFQNIEKTNNSLGLAGMDKADIKNAGGYMQEEIMSLEKKQEELLFDEQLVGTNEKERFLNDIKLSVLKTKAENLKAVIETDKEILEPIKKRLKRTPEEEKFIVNSINESKDYITMLSNEMAEYLDFKVDEIKAAMKGDGDKLPEIDESELTNEQIERIRQGIMESDEIYLSMKEMHDRISQEKGSYRVNEELAVGLANKIAKNSEEYDKCQKEIERLKKRQLEILESQGFSKDADENNLLKMDIDFDISKLDINYDNVFEKTAMVMEYENQINEKKQEYSKLNDEEKTGEKGRLLNEQIKELQLSKDDAKDDINRAYADINETKNNMFRSFLDNESLTEEDKKYKAKLEKFQENVKNDLRIEELTEKRKEYEKAEGTFHSYVKAKDIVGKKLEEIREVLDKNTKKDDTELYTSMKNAFDTAKDKVSKAKSMKEINDALQPLKAPTEQYIRERDSFFKFSSVGANRVVAAKNIRGIIDSFSGIYKDNEDRINAISEKNEIIGKQYGYNRENKPTKIIDKSFKELLDNPSVLDKVQKNRRVRLDKEREKYRKEIEKDIGLGKH